MMRRSNEEMWAQASAIAWAVMGRPQNKKDKLYKSHADEDPLAWWLATEMIFNYARPQSAYRDD